MDRLPRIERILGVALERFPLAVVEEVSASGASTAPRLASLVLPDGRTLTANPGGPFGKPIVTMPGEKVPG